MSVSRFAQWHWSLGSLCVHAVCFPRAEEGAIPSSETCANMGPVATERFIESKEYAVKQGVAAVAAGVDASEAVTEPRLPVTNVSHVSTREFMLEHHNLLQFFAYYAVMTVLTVQ